LSPIVDVDEDAVGQQVRVASVGVAYPGHPALATLDAHTAVTILRDRWYYVTLSLVGVGAIVGFMFTHPDAGRPTVGQTFHVGW